MFAGSFIGELSVEAEPNAPGSVGPGGLCAIMVREAENKGGCARRAAGCEPAWLRCGELEVDLGTGVDVACTDSFLTQRA